MENYRNNTFSANQTATNSTRASTFPPWNAADGIATTISATSIIVNFLMFLKLAKQARRTTFEVYLMILLLLNAVFFTAGCPLDLIQRIYGKWVLGSFACTFLQYTYYVAEPMIRYMHVFITLDRIWAVSYPITYRNQQNKKVAVTMFFCMVAYTHCLGLPAVILDHLYYRANELKYGCYLNFQAQAAFVLGLTALFFDLPLVLVCVAYPYLLLRHFRNRKAHVAIAPNSGPSGPTGVTASSSAAANSEVKAAPAVPVLAKKNTRRTRPFVVMSLLTASVFVCWTPDTIYYTMVCVMDVEIAEGWVTFIGMLYNFQSVLDPLLYAASMTGIGNAWNSCVKKMRTSSV